MRILIALAAMILHGCASFDPPFSPEFERGPNTKKHYTYVDTPDQMAALCGPPAHGHRDLGCARVPKSADGVCIITLYRGEDGWVKKHEEDHCRYGRFHP